MVNLNFLSNDYRDKRSNSEIISESIMIDILTGNLKGGFWLSEPYLTKKYNISRTPIREILNKLLGTGLVEQIPKRGFFVRHITERDIDDYFNMIYQLYPLSVKWAIERITKKELDTLKEVFNFLEFYSKQNDLEKIKLVYKGFNLVIYDACKNKEIEKTLKLYDFIINYGTLSIPYPINYIDNLLEECKNIFAAFLKKDSNQGFEAAQIAKYKQMLRKK